MTILLSFNCNPASILFWRVVPSWTSTGLARKLVIVTKFSSTLLAPTPGGVGELAARDEPGD